ncbi:hypothetical protein D3C80_1443140 [compost metagenome]
MSDDTLASTRTCPRAPSAYSLSSPCSRSMSRMNFRAWRSKACPAGVGATPFLLRTNSAVANADSMSEMRLLTAEGAMNSRAAAAAILPSSHAAMNSLSDTGSNCHMVFLLQTQSTGIVLEDAKPGEQLQRQSILSTCDPLHDHTTRSMQEQICGLHGPAPTYKNSTCRSAW